MKNPRFFCQNLLASMLILTGVHCSSSSSTSPGRPTDPVGSAGQAGNGGSAPSAGFGGESGQGGAIYDTSVCPEACGRLASCEVSVVDIPVCEAQCKKELTGEGFLIPEMGNDFFVSLKNAEPGQECSFLVGYYWDKWSPSSAPKGKYDKLLEQDVLMECHDALSNCDKATPSSDYKAQCIIMYYRYRKEKRQEIKPCFDLKCPAPESCVTQISYGMKELWLGQPEQ